jgi:hypothetical protein
VTDTARLDIGADSWVEVANEALGRADFSRADTAARVALADEPGHRGAWVALAAGYAGLGWFDESRKCLRLAGEQPLDAGERRTLGRAVNRWALGATHWPFATAALAPILGALAVAIGSSLPFAARSRRLAVLRRFEAADGSIDGTRGWAMPEGATGPEPTFWIMAEQAWPVEWRLRVVHAVVVLASVGLWATAWGSTLNWF